MSLDVYLTLKGQAAKLTGSGIFIREDGRTREISQREWDRRFPGRQPYVVLSDEEDGEVFHANITHNLGQMADDAGIHKCLWRPEEVGISHAAQLVEPLRSGLALLQSDPERFKKFNPENGWGNYEGLLDFVARYLSAAMTYPDAEVRVWR